MNSVFVAVILLITSLLVHSYPIVPETRIAGGSDAKPKSAPYIVSIQNKLSDGSYQHICGGSIIDQHWILTAAHCLHSPINPKKLRLEAGRYNLKKSENTVQERSIDYYKIHKLYNGGIAPYDIALIYVNKVFTWTDSVKAISLPSSGTIPSGNVKLFGWGSTSKTGAGVFPDILQTANLELITFSKCEQILGKESVNLHETNICTISPPEGVGICQADSGGPLNGKDQLVGIVSWGPSPCGRPNSASVYVRVSAFIDWINKVKQEHKME